jgi:hypothetical protein
MYDKENKHLSKFVLAKMTTLTQFQKHFDTIFRTANAKKPARHMLVIKFKSAFSLYEIKNQEFVQKYLDEYNIYLRDHSFEYVLDTTSPGWIFGKHPQHHWPDDVKLEMIADINLACPNQTVPFFHLESCTPRRTEESGMNFRTQALGIHVDRNKNKKLEELLKKTYNGEGKKSIFVAWSFKQLQKNAFRDAMIAQTTYLTKVWVVPIHGISISQMRTIRPLLLAMASVDSVKQTKKTKESGRWNVLVNKLHSRK